MLRPSGLTRVPPTILVLASIASVQAGSSVAKSLFDAAPPVTVAWLRLVSAAVVLGLIARPALRGRTPRQWRDVVLYGLVMTAMNLTFYLSIERIPVGMAVTIEFLGPLGVAVAGSRRGRDLLWVGLAGVGVLLLGFTPGDLDCLGIGLAAAAAACWAAYIVLAGPVGRTFSGISGVTVACWIGAVTLAVPALLVGGASLGNPQVWGLGLLVGLMASVIPYGLEMVALRRIDRGVFGILMSLEPAAAAFFAFLMLGEGLGPVELLAMACVILASLGATFASRSVQGATPGP